MRRGDIVLVTTPGDYGKRRLAVVIQSNLFNDVHASVIVCLMSSDLVDAPLFRLTVEPTTENGLRPPSQIMVDKMAALRRERIGPRIGVVDEPSMVRLNRSLVLFLGIAQ